jgi:predicted amidohydrolase
MTETDKIGRPVRITSISFANGRTRDEVFALVDREGARGTDLIALPETFLGQAADNSTMEALDGPTVTGLATLARKHKTYIVCPLDRRDGDGIGDQRLNTAVLLDRTGAVAGLYDKVFPYWSEFDKNQVVEPGQEAPVFETDFGQVGLSICFDANFPEVWARLADQGAELVIWPSAYSAGTTLQAHALMNHFAIVTSTQTRDCVVYDINGKEILYEVSPDVNVSRITLDLDRCIFHENFNMDKRERLLQEHADDIELEEHLLREQWFILRAKRPGVSARALAQQYGMEDLRAYISRSRREIDAMRGWTFSKTTYGAAQAYWYRHRASIGTATLGYWRRTRRGGNW